LRAELIVTVHVVELPEQSPDQPVKIEPADAVAVSVTIVFSVNVAPHVAPQLMPDGAEVSVPDPEPDLVAVSVWGVPKMAVTSRAAFIVTAQVVELPEQSPDQPTKLEPPPPALAVSITTVPSLYVALHVAPQLMPPRSDVTVPVPEPPRPTWSGYVVTPLKAAVTDCAWSRVTEQVAPLPVHAPDQPSNVCPVPGVAVRVTTVPAPYTSEQNVSPFPHRIVPGLDVTTPLPVTDTSSVYVCSVNVAVTERAWLIVTVHGADPEHPSPLKPLNVQPALVEAVSVTSVPAT
jgi:hypothetical protein